MTMIEPVEVTEKKEWRCFQCDEVFTEREKALLHFGLMEAVPPRCCIDEDRYGQLHARLMLKEMT